MSIRNIRRGRAAGPSLHSYNTTHGLEVVTGPDIARIALPAASQQNAPLLDIAAGHVCALGAPPNESVCLTSGIRLIGGAWQYEPGSTLGRVIRLEPNGQVEFWLGTGSPITWYLQAWIDGYGNITTTGNLQVDGTFTPSAP